MFWLLRQPGERLCDGCLAGQGRRHVPALPRAPRVSSQPLSSRLACPGFSEQCGHCEQWDNWYPKQDHRHAGITVVRTLPAVRPCAGSPSRDRGNDGSSRLEGRDGRPRVCWDRAGGRRYQRGPGLLSTDLRLAGPSWSSGPGFSGRSHPQGARADWRAFASTFGAEKLKTGLQHLRRRQRCMQSLGRWGQQARPEGTSLADVFQFEPQKQTSVLTAEFVKGCESRMKLKKGTKVGCVLEKGHRD